MLGFQQNKGTGGEHSQCSSESILQMLEVVVSPLCNATHISLHLHQSDFMQFSSNHQCLAIRIRRFLFFSFFQEITILCMIFCRTLLVAYLKVNIMCGRSRPEQERGSLVDMRVISRHLYLYLLTDGDRAWVRIPCALPWLPVNWLAFGHSSRSGADCICGDKAGHARYFSEREREKSHSLFCLFPAGLF